MSSGNKVTYLFFVDKHSSRQRDKAETMILTFIKNEDIVRYQATRDYIYIETDTQLFRIVSINPPALSVRGHRANFIIDFTRYEHLHMYADMNSTWDRNSIGEGETYKRIPVESVQSQLKKNGHING